MADENYTEKVETLLIQERFDRLKEIHADKREGPPVEREEPEFIIEIDELGRETSYLNPKHTATMFARWEAMVEGSGLNPNLPEPAQTDKWTQDTARVLAEGGKNAILHGSPGKGKTTLALIASKALYGRGRPFLIIRSPDWMEKFLPRYQDEERITRSRVLEKLVSPTYLLMDEVGYGKDISSFMQEVMLDIISKRDALGKFTWWTTNRGIGWLERGYGEAVMSRMNKVDGCLTIDFGNRPNYRSLRK